MSSKATEFSIVVPISNTPTAIARTERGLAISGTRITLYDVMDYLLAQYPSTLIRSLLNLTEDQIRAALSYIEANRVEVEAEYQLVLQQAEESRRYWEERNREHFARIAAIPPQPDREALRAKLRAQRIEREAET